MPDCGLNEKQMLALHHGEGPAIVFAGPGSGKTTVLTKRTAHLILERGISPASILVITYTKAAALSMQHRFFTEMKGMSPPVTFGTFHAVFYQILRSRYHFKADGLLSDGGKRILLSHILKQFHMEWDIGEQLLACISLQKNGRTTLPLPEQVSREQFEEISRLYAARTAALGKLDFDDMLTKCRTLLTEDAQERSRWQRRFSYLLADEFQDCNAIQYELLGLLAEPERNLFVVGDDDQSIYGFRGAAPGIMRRFLKDYPDAQRYLLTENYRSAGEIVDAAGRVISQNKDRVPKQCTACESNQRSPAQIKVRAFPDKDTQYAYLAAQIKENRAIPFRENAVLCRTNAGLAAVQGILEREKIPCIGGNRRESLYQSFFAEDLRCYLAMAAGDCRREKVLCVINHPERGIGREGMGEGQISLTALAQSYEACGQRREADRIRELASQLEKMRKMSPYLAIGMVRKTVGYDRYLSERAGKNRLLYEEWGKGVSRLQEEAKQFARIEDWLSYMEAQKRTQPSGGAICGGGGDGVRLMTLHASKGLEFSRVFIPDVNEGNIPYGRMLSDETAEEERRLFYVGMTRAKTALQLLCVQGTNASGQPSRFLKPLADWWDQSSESSSNSSNS